MKYFFLTAALFFLGVNSTPTIGQKIVDDKHYYVVMTKNIEQLKPLIMSAEALMEEDGAKFGDFQVIICGKNIGDITDPEKMGAHLEHAQKYGVKLIACGFSIKRFGVEVNNVPDGMTIVDNGILHNFRLQKQGYKSLGL